MLLYPPIPAGHSANVILWNFELKAVYTAQKPLFH